MGKCVMIAVVEESMYEMFSAAVTSNISLAKDKTEYLFYLHRSCWYHVAHNCETIIFFKTNLALARLEQIIQKSCERTVGSFESSPNNVYSWEHRFVSCRPLRKGVRVVMMEKLTQ